MKLRLLLCLAFVLTSVARATEWVTLPSGVRYAVTSAGDGRFAKPGDIIEFYYTGRLEDGSVFQDTHRSIAGGPLGYDVGSPDFTPRGLFEALGCLRAGDKALIVVPPALGYGEAGNAHIKVPSNATLQYDVEVVGIKSRRLAPILWAAIEEKGMAGARALFVELKAGNFREVYAGSFELAGLGHILLYRLNRIDDAIELLRWNCEINPGSAYAHWKLADAYYVAGNRDAAIAHYSLEVSMDPDPRNADFRLRSLKEHPESPTEFERLKVLLNPDNIGTTCERPYEKTVPNYRFLEERLDAFLATVAPSAEKGQGVESLLGLVLAAKPPLPTAQALWSKYGDNADPEIRAAVQRAREAPEKARVRREAAQRAKEAVQKKEVNLRFTALDGREVDTAKLRGKVVLIDFWATWCGPCIDEVPNVVESYRKYRDRGFEVIGITLDKVNVPEKKLLDFCAKHEMTWPQCFDAKRGGAKFADQFGVQLIPAMFLLDQNGMIVSTNARGSKLEPEIRRLLGLAPLEAAKPN